MGRQVTRQKLLNLYNRLMAYYGPQHWWPADEPFEVIVGAILTQSAAWTNVAKAIVNLKKADALSPQALRRLPVSQIAELIYSCGYYNVKAVKLRSFVDWFGERYQDSLDKLFAPDIRVLREALLSVNGIGEETADSIILYAAEKPVFVIDAYTRRIIDRLGIKPERNSYQAYQTLFMEHLPQDIPMFNEYHALLVALGKEFCRKKPLCAECFLKDMCDFYIINAGKGDLHSSIHAARIA